MDILSIAAEVSRQKNELESLKLDPAIDADSLRKCGYVFYGIETSLLELTQPWVPRDLPNIKVLHCQHE